MTVPAGWRQVRVNPKVTFALPPELVEVSVRGTDSDVKRWESKNLVVYSDYGPFSDPLTTYSQKKAYSATMEQFGAQSARIVSFQREDAWWFTAVYLPDLGKSPWDQTMKLTVVVESSPEVGREIPLTILKSIAI